MLLQPPEAVLSPGEVLLGQPKTVEVPLETARGGVLAQVIAPYPPGIPLLSPGEKITREIVDFIHSSREMGGVLTGTQDIEARTIQVLRRLDRKLCRLSVGFHKAARAEKRSSEVSCDDYRRVGYTALSQHVERRQSRRSLRLPVVGIAADIAISE